MFNTFFIIYVLVGAVWGLYSLHKQREMCARDQYDCPLSWYALVFSINAAAWPVSMIIARKIN